MWGLKERLQKAKAAAGSGQRTKGQNRAVRQHRERKYKRKAREAKADRRNIKKTGLSSQEA